MSNFNRREEFPTRDYDDEKSITPSIFSNVWKRAQRKEKSVTSGRDAIERKSFLSAGLSRRESLVETGTKIKSGTAKSKTRHS